jgi:hypothetical protein
VTRIAVDMEAACIPVSMPCGPGGSAVSGREGMGIGGMVVP